MGTDHIVKSYDQEITLLSRKVLEMGGLVEHQIAKAIDALVKRSVEDAAKVIESDDQIDRMEEEIDQHVIRLLATRQPMAIDLRLITMAMKIANDLERIGDYAANIAKRCKRLAASPPIKPLYTIPRMALITQAMVKDVLDAYVARDSDKAVAAWHRDDEVDSMYTSVFRELLTYMMEDPRNISPALDLIAVAKHLERMADHATNIAEKIHYMIHAQRINRLPAEV
ncbi:MAG TPA: phosphate signaling complex protein PhoU [Geminicoccaceae bacterium]|nr:phosphate signaling complex protein PhoU [Geminicoccaceae bacterium]